MIVYGRNPVREAARGPRAVRQAWATPAAARTAGFLTHAGVPLATVKDARTLEARCGSPGHQGLCAEVEEFRYADIGTLLALEAPLIVALDEVQDPQNLGSVCRSAECAGASGLVIPKRRSAAVTPAVCRASAGAVEHLPVARVGNLADFLDRARTVGCWAYGACARARVSYDVPDYRGGVVLVLGSERRGLRPRVAAACDELIALPLRGRIGSLNVGAAAAALLYEILQRRLDTPPSSMRGSRTTV